MPTSDCPRLRSVEVFPFEQDGQTVLVVHDPTKLASGSIMVSGAALFILSLMDGRHSREEIRKAFLAKFSTPLPEDDLQAMIQQLDAAHFLDGPTFAAYYQSLVDGYRASPARMCRTADLAEDGQSLRDAIGRMLGHCEVSLAGPGGRRLAGLVAPHLDFARGGPCYADAYGVLATAPAAERYVVLGTNHYGRGTSVVATGKAFQSPFGTTRTDSDFLAELERRCGADLCVHEFDHQQEHSVELQVLILQYLLGADRFEIVPLLCHDPCQPNGDGVDLREFGRILGRLIAEDGKPTVIIAGADLSHVGRRFGDDRDLDTEFLSHIERLDRKTLELVVASEGESFLDCLRAHENSTRVCSAGCIYALMTALPEARPELLRYHQAYDPDTETCVTCSAVAFWD